MEYVLGGSTGLLKEADTSNRSLLRLSPLEKQSLDKNVTAMCWSGGFGGYFEDEITVGCKDGSLMSYNYLTMKANREYKLDSRCVYLAMLNHHFDLFGPGVYQKNSDSQLYPGLERPGVYDTNDRLLLAVSEAGYIYVFDWSVDKSENVATVKHVGQGTNEAKKADKGVKLEEKVDRGGSNVPKSGNKRQKVSKDGSLQEYVGALFVYKLRGPLSDARLHSLMRNRLLLGGPNNPPVLFDLFSESVLWTGKYPHETLLGLQSKLEITSLCFLEEVDDDVVCVATRDSFIYVYCLKSQRDPVFEFNICDYRSIGLSKRLLSLFHHDYNSKHRKTLSTAVNEKYSQSDRTILKLATRPSYKVHFVGDTDPANGDRAQGGLNEVPPPDSGNLYRVNDRVYLSLPEEGKKDYCSLYVADNFGTIYSLQFLSGLRLVQWIYRKISPIIESKRKEARGRDGTGKEAHVSKELDDERVLAMSDKERHEIVEHLLEARRRLCSSSNNDKRVHFRKNSYSQFVCRILRCFNAHNGSVVDLACSGDYLFSAGLDRYSNVFNLRTGKLVFTLYCNQKQSRVLLKNRWLFTSFQDKAEFKSNLPEEPQGVNSDPGEGSGLEDNEDESMGSEAGLSPASSEDLDPGTDFDLSESDPESSDS